MTSSEVCHNMNIMEALPLQAMNIAREKFCVQSFFSTQGEKKGREAESVIRICQRGES